MNEKEQADLVSLGKDIQANLSCDVNGTGLPCRTDRLEAVSDMKRYLEIHGYKISPPIGQLPHPKLMPARSFGIYRDRAASRIESVIIDAEADESFFKDEKNTKDR